MGNRKTGVAFEATFCEILASFGFWVHNLAQNKAGQPADVIAVKDGFACLIDCKVCSNDKFSLSRIEENQHLSMSLWNRKGNGDGWFALKTSLGVFMISYPVLKKAEEKKVTLNLTDIQAMGIPLMKWVG